MTDRVYYRPVSLLFGKDARQAISAGWAGRLGGHDQIAFSHVERIERKGSETSRRVLDFDEFASDPICGAITAKRADFGPLSLDATRVMGIANVTPDSFSDGGRLSNAGAAIAFCEQMITDAADIIDVGGESTRPGSDPVSEEEEAQRIVPVIEAFAGRIAVSADTRKPDVMRIAARAGAGIINDVSGLTYHADNAKTIAELGLPVAIMHAQGEPKTMQLSPKYEDVLLDVYDVLEERIALAEAAGIPKSNIMIDPGIGFGKTYRHNLDVLQGLSIYHGLGVALMVGASRKAFIGALTGESVAANRIVGSTAVAVQASLMGSHLVRVHDVKQTKQSLSVFWAAMDPDSTDL